jgi:hypothetical protein
VSAPEDPIDDYLTWVQKHQTALLWLSGAILVAFVAVTGWVLLPASHSSPEVRGSVIQTWNNLAVGVGAFWFANQLIRRKG